MISPLVLAIRKNACIGLIATGLCVSLPALAWPQVGGRAQDPAEAMKNMFEIFGKQADQFVPGMFSEMSPEQMAKLEKIKISPGEEQKYGQQVLSNYEASLKGRGQSIVRQGKDVDYVKALVAEMAKQMTNRNRYRTIDVALVETKETDAYSVPGGHLIFTTGLIDSLRSEAELVGVIGHELSHLDRGHQLLPLKQSKSVPNWSDPRGAMSWMATMFKPFRPEFEAQADADAVRWMLAAGYDPRELARLLARWDARQNGQTPWTNMLPDFARSHPDPGRRAQTVLRDFDQLPRKPANLIVGRQNLIDRIPSSQQRIPDPPAP